MVVCTCLPVVCVCVVNGVVAARFEISDRGEVAFKVQLCICWGKYVDLVGHVRGGV